MSAAVMKGAALLAAALALPAAAPVAPTVDTEGALRILLAASSMPVPRTSSCYGIIPGVPRPTLGDLLATPLGALDGGANRVTGGCEGGSCRVLITHAAGDDEFSSEFRFRTVRGRLSPASLNCVITP